jgi:hypothetical protein
MYRNRSVILAKKDMLVSLVSIQRLDDNILIQTTLLSNVNRQATKLNAPYLTTVIYAQTIKHE